MFKTEKSGLAGSTASKTLVVTNKRIIHREIGEGTDNEFINTSEMPVKSAKYVNTYYNKVGFPIFLVLAIIFAITAVVSLILTFVMAEEMNQDPNPIMSFIFIILAVVFFIIYKEKKQYKFSCTIDTDTEITPAFTFASTTSNTKTNGIFRKAKKANATTAVRIVVNGAVAKEMADELGYVIMSAANGDYDDTTDAE